MANQQNSYTGSQGTGTNNADFSFTFPSFTTSEVKVEVDNVVKTLTTHYTVENYNTTSGGIVRFTTNNIPTGTTPVRIFRQTDVDSPKATFTAGSSLKAGEINDNFKQVRHALQEAIGANATDRKIQPFNIEDGAITSAAIKDLTIARGDIANDAIDGTKIADDSVDSEHIVADSLDTEHYAPGSVDNTALGSDAVTNAKIADDQIDSEHYVDLSVDTQHIANENVTTAKLAPDAVVASKIADDQINTEHIAANQVTSKHYADDSIQLNHMSANSVDSNQYVDGSIDHVHLANDVIDGDNIQDNVINSEHYVDGSIDHVHLANDIIDGDNIQDDVVNSEHIAAGALDNEHYAAGSITSDKLSDATVITASEQASATTNDTSFLTSAAADARFFNISTGDTIKDGDTFPDNDTTIATTAAINDRIIDLVDDVGGFVPIANETSFPTSNPDINNPATGGTIVSVKAASTNLAPSGTTVTIANGRGSGLAVVITGVTATIPSGFGFLVETTSTDHTYAFHRLVPKATEVTTVAGKATEIGRLGTAAAVEDMSILGTADVVADLNTLGTADVVSDLNTLGTADVVADMNTLAVTSVVNNMDTVATNVANVNTTAGSIGNVNTTAGSIANVNTVAGSIANVNTTAGSISNVNSVAGSIANVNTTASNIANVNNFAATYQIASSAPSTDGAGNALAAGDLYFDTTANELRVHNGSTFQGGVTATGNLAGLGANTFTGNQTISADLEISTAFPKIKLTDTDSNSDFTIQNANGDWRILDETNNAVRLTIASDGTVDVAGNLDANGGLDVTGNITVSGNVDGRDVAADGVKLDGIETGATADQSASDIKTLLNSSGLVNAQIDASAAIARTKLANVDVVDDTSPQLGGFLDTNGYHIVFPDSSGSGNNRLKFGASQDLEIYHDGTDTYIDNDTGNLDIVCNSNQAINLKHGSENMLRAITDGAVEIYHDNSKKFNTLADGVHVHGQIQLNDNGKLNVGDHDDLQIYHDGSNSVIKEAGTGDFRIQTASFRLRNEDASEMMISADADGAVYLAYDGTTKLRTDNFGVIVPGGLAIDGDNLELRIGNGQDLKLYHDGTDSHILNTNNSGELKIRAHQTDIKNADNNETQAVFHENGAVELYYDNTKRLETIDGGANITGNLGIGTTSPTSLIDARDTTGATIQCRNTTSNVGHIGINVGSAENFVFSRGASSSDKRQLTFMLGNSTAAKINTDLHLIPAADSTHDLGLTGTRWRNIYADTLYGDGSNLTGVSQDVVTDTSPQLGGHLDVSGQDIVTTSNADIDLIPNGTGQIVGGGTTGLKLPVGTTAQRVNTEGLLRYNSESNKPEYYDGNNWIPIETPPTLESINNTNPTSAQISSGFDLVLTGANFTSGSTVKFIGNDGTQYTSSTVTVNSTSQITARVPSGVTNANEPYDVRVTSSAGSQSTLENAMNVNATPSWTTASGTLATIDDTDTGTHATIAATDPDGSTITYSGTVGGGLSLNSSTGAITGDPTDVSSSTTLSFTATATDAGGAAVNRSFNIIVNPVIDGSTQAKAAASAAAIKTLTGTTTNGVYWIKPSGVSTAYQAYCNMNIGGGVILAAKIDNDSSSTSSSGYWKYSSNLWTSTTTHDTSSLNTAETHAKLQPAVDFPMNYFYVTDNDMSHWVRFDLSSQTTGFHNIWAGQNRSFSVGSTVGTHRSHSSVATDHDLVHDGDTGNSTTSSTNTINGYDTEDWDKNLGMGNYGNWGSDSKARLGQGAWSDSGPWGSVHSIMRGLGLVAANHANADGGTYYHRPATKFQMIFVA